MRWERLGDWGAVIWLIMYESKEKAFRAGRWY